MIAQAIREVHDHLALDDGTLIAIDRVTLDPTRVTAIARCALVLTHFQDKAAPTPPQ